MRYSTQRLSGKIHCHIGLNDGGGFVVCESRANILSLAKLFHQKPEGA
jgi:hypothetical protein